MLRAAGRMVDDDAALSRVERNAAALSQLADQLLDLARLEAGQMPVRARACDLGSVAREVATQLAPPGAPRIVIEVTGKHVVRPRRSHACHADLHEPRGQRAPSARVGRRRRPRHDPAPHGSRQRRTRRRLLRGRRHRRRPRRAPRSVARPSSRASSRSTPTQHRVGHRPPAGARAGGRERRHAHAPRDVRPHHLPPGPPRHHRPRRPPSPPLPLPLSLPPLAPAPALRSRGSASRPRRRILVVEDNPDMGLLLVRSLRQRPIASST